MSITGDVENILSTSREARNSDKSLQITFMQKAGMGLSEGQIEAFKRMPSLETVRRIRQKLQEKGKYLADQKIKNERHWKALRMQQVSPKAKPKTIEKIIIPWGQG